MHLTNTKIAAQTVVHWQESIQAVSKGNVQIEITNHKLHLFIQPSRCRLNQAAPECVTEHLRLHQLIVSVAVHERQHMFIIHTDFITYSSPDVLKVSHFPQAQENTG